MSSNELISEKRKEHLIGIPQPIITLQETVPDVSDEKL